MAALAENIKFLICFAHRGEASAFLEKRNWILNSNVRVQGFHQFEDWGILFTGEGLPMASHKLAVLLGELPNIQHVYNFGICGSLTEKHPVHSTHWIRQFYFENSSQELQFQSYPGHEVLNSSEKNRNDLISVNSRVLNAEYGAKLYPIAPLVDREAWGQAQVCQLLKIPFSSFKVVSDTTAKPPQDDKLCRLIQDQAKEFSEILFKEWETILKPNSEIGKTPEKKDPANLLFHELMKNKYFHWTFSQQQKLSQILKRLDGLKYSHQFLKEFMLKRSYEKQDIQPKERAKLLIDDLAMIANPVQAGIKKRILNDLNQKHQNLVAVSFDPQLEGESLTIEFEVSNMVELERAQEELKKIQFQEFFSMLKGDFNVQKNSD